MLTRDDDYLKEYAKLRKCDFSFALKYNKLEEQENFLVLQKALSKAGVKIDIENESYGSFLRIKIDPDKYIKAEKRNAGRRGKGFKYPDSQIDLKGTDIMYSDVVFLMQSMSDKEIIEKLGIKYATYYRHKKALMESIYYEKVDKERLGDIDYLKSRELFMWDENF